MIQNCNVIINLFQIDGSAQTPLQRSVQLYQPRQTKQTPINNSMHLQPTIGQIPYNSHSQQNPNFSDIHSFNLLKRGKGIDKN